MTVLLGQLLLKHPGLDGFHLHSVVCFKTLCIDFASKALDILCFGLAAVFLYNRREEKCHSEWQMEQ